MSDNNIKKIKHLSFSKDNKPSNIISDDSVDINQINRDSETAISDDDNEDVTAVMLNRSNIGNNVPDPDSTEVPSPAKDTKKPNEKENSGEGKNESRFSSLFAKEQQELSGVKRVFQKSVLFFTLASVAFSGVCLAGVQLFSATNNLLLTFILAIVSIVLFVTLTNTFFIILADRLYLLAFLSLQAVILLLTNALVGAGFTIGTFIILIVLILMMYMAYLELEKNQLSSRLFNISHITTEASRILTTTAILVLCLGFFNFIIHTSTENGEFTSSNKFISQTFLDNNNFVDATLIGYSSSTGRGSGVNNFTMNKNLAFRNNKLTVISDGSDATFKEFLQYNYKPSELILTEAEQDEITAKCSRDKVQDCDTVIAEVKNQKLEGWKQEGYGNLSNLTLASPMTLANYREVTKQFYLNLVKDFSKDNSESTKSFIPVPLISNFSPKYIIPAGFIFIIFLILMLIRPIINIFTLLFTWMVWQILKITGFAKIEIETVESEVVSI